eukprot:jgi/Tetstr1/421409/TSEL_001176.t1
MIRLIAEYGGDVDCFAGDAVLVVFEPSGGADSHPAAMRLVEPLRRALACARDVQRRLDGFRHEPADPPLSVHSALAAGELLCLECGGRLVERSEAFVIGAPLSEIATALALSSKSEIVLAPSAAQLLGGVQAGAPGWRVVELADGHIRTAPVTPADSDAAAPMLGSYTSIGGEDDSRDLAHATNSRVIELMQRRAPDGRGIQAATAEDPAELDRMGMDALLRFVPSFVQRSCLEGRGSQGLMEHRMVSILFCIADMKSHESKYSDRQWTSGLQSLLGDCIDTVEGQMGGATRQITVDDKGLAMIFVFGLPGYQCSKVSMPCLQAGRKVVAMMSAAGLACTAGVTMGMCFCGLVGDPSIRCEYMVMGDRVNTAARLAVAAAEQGSMLLCSQDVVMSITSHQLIAHQLVLQPAGCIPLKGKRGEVKVYRPEADVNKHKEGVATKIVGRDTERAMLQTVLGGSNAETPTGSLGAVVALLEGRHGLGRSTLAEGLLQEVQERQE